LDFWYQSYVSSNSTLNVYIQNGTAMPAITWSRPGTTERDEWSHGSVNLGVIRGSVHLQISG